jgi:hypothetical protein
MSASLIAIDPGMSGGVAWIREGQVGACRMPPEDELNDLFFTLGPIRAVYTELVPWVLGVRISPASVGKLHYNRGLCEGLVIGRGIRLVRVEPKVWQAKFHLGSRKDAGGYSQWKRKLKTEAARRFPDLDVTLDTADALLMLEFARDAEGKIQQ